MCFARVSTDTRCRLSLQVVQLSKTLLKTLRPMTNRPKSLEQPSKAHARYDKTLIGSHVVGRGGGQKEVVDVG